MNIAIDFDDTLIFTAIEISSILNTIARKIKLEISIISPPLSGKNRREFYMNYKFNQIMSYEKFNQLFAQERKSLLRNSHISGLYSINKPLAEDISKYVLRKHDCIVSILTFRDEHSTNYLAAKLNIDSYFSINKIVSLDSRQTKQDFISKEFDCSVLIDDNISNLIGLPSPTIGVHFVNNQYSVVVNSTLVGMSGPRIYDILCCLNKEQ